jgi:hypothetical protein
MKEPTKGRWPRRLGIGCGGLLLLLIIAATALWISKPWVPDIESAAPGPGGQRVTIGGNIGNFYPGPAGQRSAAILVLGGSEGGLGNGADSRARALHAQGYTTLALSWYRLPGQPERLERVPLETFYAALDWLAVRPEVDPARIAMFGTSKGAEAALLVAARRPQQVRAVVAAMPSHVVWQGFDWSMMPVNTSSWSEGGRPVPYLPITTADWSGDIYGPALASLPRHQNTIIPVERIIGAVLLACGEADSLWPSCRMARAVRDRRVQAGGITTELLAYRDAGHGGHGPPVAAGTPAAERIASLGGTIAGNLAAREDGWPRTLAFLATALAPETAQ